MPVRTYLELDAPLVDAVLDEWSREVPDAVTIAAKDIASRFDGYVDGVLFYGSCLRTGIYEDRILDFYVIVDSYLSAYKNKALGVANAVIPPNVFYHEIDVDGVTVRSKYAVLSRADYHRRTSRACMNISVWARFCQPAMLMLARDERAHREIAADTANAMVTMLSHARPLLAKRPSAEDWWVRAFTETYRAELRSERGDKGQEIYELDKERYDRMTPLVLDALGEGQVIDTTDVIYQPPRGPKIRSEVMWFLRRLNGKGASLARLIKATMTFDGGMDYLAWKIRRHSGVEVDIKPWMRRAPIIGAPVLAIQLRMKGAFR